jgi:creatinine amidohydrolase/Fe(II)-dependent formamide hydrolase-like protein
MHKLSLAAAMAVGLVLTQAAFAAEPLVEFDLMTWPEVKQALADGKTTALIYTGGVEQRGPQAVNGLHNFIVRKLVKEIALRLGNAIAMPVLPFTPNNANPDLPGTIGLTNDILGSVLERITEQTIANGFKNVVLAGDHGGGQGTDNVYAAIARKLDDKYGAKGIHVYYCEACYKAAHEAFDTYLAEHGLPASSHAGLADTSEALYWEDDGAWVRKDKLATAVGDPVVNGKVVVGPDSPRNGIAGDARGAKPEYGKVREDIKIDIAVKQIQAWIPVR